MRLEEEEGGSEVMLCPFQIVVVKKRSSLDHLPDLILVAMMLPSSPPFRPPLRNPNLPRHPRRKQPHLRRRRKQGAAVVEVLLLPNPRPLPEGRGEPARRSSLWQTSLRMSWLLSTVPRNAAIRARLVEWM